MRKIIRRRVILRGRKTRKRKLQKLLLLTTPAPPPAGTPNKDFFFLTRPRKHRRKKHRRSKAIQKRDRKLLKLLFLQSAPSSVRVPEVEHILVASALSVLNNAGLIGHVTFKSSFTVPIDIVISQGTAAGTLVAIGSTIELLVSSGSTLLPNVQGMAVAAAEALLIGLGLLPVATQLPTVNTPPGIVIKQVPPPGSRVLLGTEVFLIVSMSPPASASRAQLPSTEGIVNVTTFVQ